MASVRFTPKGLDARGKPVYTACYSISGKDLPKGAQLPTRDLVKMRPGIRGYVPRGVDQKRF
jgi:hypothetical protein